MSPHEGAARGEEGKVFAIVVVALLVAVLVYAAASVAVRKRRGRGAAEAYDLAHAASQLNGLAERTRVMNSPLYDVHHRIEFLRQEAERLNAEQIHIESTPEERRRTNRG